MRIGSAGFGTRDFLLSTRRTEFYRVLPSFFRNVWTGQEVRHLEAERPEGRDQDGVAVPVRRRVPDALEAGRRLRPRHPQRQLHEGDQGRRGQLHRRPPAEDPPHRQRQGHFSRRFFID